MKTILLLLAGACTGAAYAAPRPWWPICLGLSTILVAVVRNLP